MKILTILTKDKNLKKLNYNMDIINTVGRRKTSVARLYMRPGKGSFVINGKELDKYFASELLRLIVEQPLKLVDASSTFDYKAFQIYLHFRVTSSFRPLSISNLSKFDGCRGENNKRCTFLENH